MTNSIFARTGLAGVLAGLLASGAMGQDMLPREMGVAVTMSKTARSKLFKDIEESGSGNFPLIDYSSVMSGGVLKFVPKLMITDMSFRDGEPSDYLEKVRSGGRLGPTMTLEYCVSFPALDVKLTNNTSRTQFFTEALLEVKSSAVDPTPLPLIFSDYDQIMHMELVNDGWGEMATLEVSYQLTTQRPRSLPETLPFKAAYSHVQDKILVEMGKSLESLGVDAEYIDMCMRYRALERQTREAEMKFDDYEKADQDPAVQRLRQATQDLYSSTNDRAQTALKPFERQRSAEANDEFEMESPYECWASGRMSYSWKDAGGQTQTQSLTFATRILLLPPEGLGAAGPVSGEHQVMLRPNGKDYTLTVPISQAVKKGEISRFLLTLGIPATSHHEMMLRLRTTEGKVTQPVPLSVHGLMPRAAAEALGMSSPAP